MTVRHIENPAGKMLNVSINKAKPSPAGELSVATSWLSYLARVECGSEICCVLTTGGTHGRIDVALRRTRYTRH